MIVTTPTAPTGALQIAGRWFGREQEALPLPAQVKARAGLPIVTEMPDVRDVERVVEVTDVVQIGSRNMHNNALLMAGEYARQATA